MIEKTGNTVLSFVLRPPAVHAIHNFHEHCYKCSTGTSRLPWGPGRCRAAATVTELIDGSFHLLQTLQALAQQKHRPVQLLQACCEFPAQTRTPGWPAAAATAGAELAAEAHLPPGSDQPCQLRLLLLLLLRLLVSAVSQGPDTSPQGHTSPQSQKSPHSQRKMCWHTDADAPPASHQRVHKGTT